MSGAVHVGLVEHAILDKAFHALIEAVDGKGDAAGPFKAFVDGLRHHLGSEDLDIARFADVEPEEAKALLQEHLRLAGFEVDFVSYFFQPLVAPIFLLRSLPHRLLPRARATERGAADLSEHGSGGLSQRVVEALLSRELRALGTGRSLAFGSSLVAVAR